MLTIVARDVGERGVSGCEVVVPGGDVFVESAHQPRHSVGLLRGRRKAPPDFAQRLVRLFVVASDAARDQVFPTVGSPAGLGLDVVDGVGGFAAIDTAVVVSTQDAAPGQGDAFRHRNSDVPREDDDARPFPQSTDSKDGVVGFVAEDRGLAGHDEDECASIRHDSERLIAGVEDECSHGVPFVPAWRVGGRGVPSGPECEHKKGTALQTVP